MKALRTRIHRLYDTEAERWWAAWDRMQTTVAGMLSWEERPVIEEAFTLPDAEWEHVVAALEAMPIMEAVTDERWTLWWQMLEEALPRPADVVDLTRWPELLPDPPEEPEEVWQEVKRLAGGSESCSRHERLGAGWVLFYLAMGRAIRTYKGRGL